MQSERSCSYSRVRPRTTTSGPVDPQGRADAFQAKWKAIFMPRAEDGAPLEPPPLEGLRDFLPAVPEGGWQPDGGWSGVTVTGPALQRRARAAAHKAPDCGGWTASALLRLPDDFWHEVAEIWNAFLRGAPLPPVLCKVLTVGGRIQTAALWRRVKHSCAHCCPRGSSSNQLFSKVRSIGLSCTGCSFKFRYFWMMVRQGTGARSMRSTNCGIDTTS